MGSLRIDLVTLLSIFLLAGHPVTVPSSGAVASPTVPVSGVALESPAVSPVPVVQAGPVPVLMYHELGDGPNELYLAVKHFEAQLDYLQAGGYHTVTLRQLYQHRFQDKPLPQKPVVLTFDDGYLSAFTEAFPRLAERKMTATFFIESDRVGQFNRVSWEHLRELVKAGFEIGSHTKAHSDLTLLSQDRLRDEVQGSKATLEKTLGISVDSFCYPSGRHDDTTLTAVRDAGYLAAVTTQYGWVGADDNPYLWRRIRVSRSDRVDGLQTKLAASP